MLPLRLKRTILLFCVLMLPLLASACNTIQGMGEDLSASGRWIAGAADKTKNTINGQ